MAENLWGLMGTSQVNMFKFPLDTASKIVEVHYWQHDLSTGGADVSDLVEGMESAHEATHVSTSQGFDQVSLTHSRVFFVSSCVPPTLTTHAHAHVHTHTYSRVHAHTPSILSHAT